MHCERYSVAKLKGNVSVIFTNNTAKQSEGISTFESNVSFGKDSSTRFTHNAAVRSGGAIYLSKRFNIAFKNGSDVSLILFITMPV